MKRKRKIKRIGKIRRGDTVTVYLADGAIIRGTLTEKSRDGFLIDGAEKYENNVLTSVGNVTVPRTDAVGYGYSRDKEAIIERYLWELTAHIPQGLKNMRIHRSRRG